MIYIAFHKKYPFLTNDPVYQPLHVGKALSNHDLGFIGDNTGDHISGKNPNYSELTGLYWIWKNTGSEWVGLSHYRRFFFAQKPGWKMQLKKVGEHLIGQGKKRFGIHYTSDQDNTRLIMGGGEVQQILEKYDAIVPLARKMKYTVWEQYKRRHRIKDLETTRQIIAERCPEYLSSFATVMEKKEIFSCNMFVMKRNHFDAYMQWLFDLLFELEKRSDISQYDNYQKRLYGFVSERLFDVWLTRQKLEVKPLPVLYFKKLKVGV